MDIFSICVSENAKFQNSELHHIQSSTGVYKYEIHKLGTEHNPKSLFFLNNVSGVVLLSSLDH